MGYLILKKIRTDFSPSLPSAMVNFAKENVSLLPMECACPPHILLSLCLVASFRIALLCWLAGWLPGAGTKEREIDLPQVPVLVGVTHDMDMDIMDVIYGAHFDGLSHSHLQILFTNIASWTLNQLLWNRFSIFIFATSLLCMPTEKLMRFFRPFTYILLATTYLHHC